MAVELNVKNYFKYYMFHPRDAELTVRQKRIATIATIALTIFTVLLVPIFTYVFIYDPHFKKVTKGGAELPIHPGSKTIPKDVMAVYKNVTIEIKHVDITTLDHDAIVNAANQQLLPGGGVCGAIRAAGGASIFDECTDYKKSKGITQVEEGHAMITKGGNLKARYVIHAVGPIWKGTDQAAAAQDKKTLNDAHTNSMKRASEFNLKSIGFTAISTGIFGFPILEAAPIAIQSITDFIDQNPGGSVKTITFAVFSENFDHYKTELQKKATVVVVEPPAVTKTVPNDFLLDFYKGTGTDIEGRFLKDMWALNDEEKAQKELDFFLWLFPSSHTYASYPKAPVLDQKLLDVMKADSKIVANVKASFVSMLKFYGFTYDEKKNEVIQAANYSERTKDWLLKRRQLYGITRILTFLVDMELKNVAQAFLVQLKILKNAGNFGSTYIGWYNIVQ